MKRARPWAAVVAVIIMGTSRADAQTAGTDPNSATPFGVAPVEDQRVYIHGVFDQFEGRVGSGTDDFRWEGEGWAGTDTNRLWVRSEGEVGGNGQTRDGQQEAFYDRPVTSYVDLQAGVRYDLDSRPGRGWGAFGVEGLTPYFFRVAATGYMSDAGHYAAKLQGYYDQLITQHLVLQPEAELNFYSRSDPRRDIGSGLSDIDAGLRLRYEITRKLAPYIAVTYQHNFGQTAVYSRAGDEAQGNVRFTFGIRTWF